MKNIFLTAAIALCALGSNSCKDQPPQPDLPPYTETGENTFGCYIDGVPFAIFKSGGPLSSTRAYFTYHTIAEKIGVRTVNENPNWNFDISVITDHFKKGIYISNGISGLGDQNVSYFFDLNGSLPSGSNIYSTNKENFLTIDLKKSIKGKHISGTFAGQLINSDGKVISVTDGRFDIKK